MVARLLIISVMALVFISCHPGPGRDVEYLSGDSINGAPRVRDEINVRLSREAALFFKNNVGININSFKVYHGSISDGNIVFAIEMKNDRGVGTWFVEFNSAGANPKLQRPM